MNKVRKQFLIMSGKTKMENIVFYALIVIKLTKKQELRKRSQY